jgi:hypothetical protein
MELRDLIDHRKGVYRESKDLLTIGIKRRMDASHKHLAGAVQLMSAGGRGGVTITGPDTVFELSIRSASIARRPTITKLIDKGDQETGVSSSWSVHFVTEECIVRKEKRRRGTHDRGGGSRSRATARNKSIHC